MLSMTFSKTEEAPRPVVIMELNLTFYLELIAGSFISSKLNDNPHNTSPFTYDLVIEL